jgi:hypothetical protein
MSRQFSSFEHCFSLSFRPPNPQRKFQHALDFFPIFKQTSTIYPQPLWLPQSGSIHALINHFPIHGNSWIINLWGNMNNYFDEESQNTNKELHHSHHTALSGCKTFLHLWTCSNAVNNKLSYSWSMNRTHSLCQWYSIIAVQLRVLPWSPRKFMNR